MPYISHATVADLYRTARLFYAQGLYASAALMQRRAARAWKALNAASSR